MSDYEVEIDGNYDLGQINVTIAGEEAMSAEFISARVDPPPPSPGVTNFAKFRKLAPGTTVKPLTIAPQAIPLPPGTNIVWRGKMVVQGTLTDVVAYR